MPRRCPACQTVIDDDRLVACPNPQCPSHFIGTTQALPLTKDQIDQLAAQLRGPVAWRILRSGWTWAGFFSLLLALFGVSYPTLRANVEEMVTSQIAQRFAEPRFRERLQEVAEKQASKMLRDEIQPEVDRFRADLQREYQALSEDVSRVTLLNSLPDLAYKASSQNDREAFEKITRVAQTETEMNSLKRRAIEEIRGVVTSLSALHFSTASPTVTLEDGTVEKFDKDTPTTRLIISLSDADWKVRAGMAMLLGYRTEKGVPDNLLQVARIDKHLRVAYCALVSFGYITGRLDKTRTRLAGQAPITLAQAMDMFNIDKLEEWWKEHSAEVNERLTDMK